LSGRSSSLARRSACTNQALEDAGQVYCGDWQVQSGNHPKPAVSFDAGATDNVAEAIKFVE